jgi:hypothetical protein
MDRALTEWEERRERAKLSTPGSLFAQPEFSDFSVASARYPSVPLAEMFEDSTKPREVRLPERHGVIAESEARPGSREARRLTCR